MALTERLAFIVDAQTGGAVREIKKVSNELDKVGGDAKKSGGLIGRFADNVGVSAATLKGGLAGAAVAAAGVLVKFGADAAKSASDLREQVSAAEVTFGNATAGIVDFAKQADTGLGLSQKAALEASNTFGAFFTNVGLGNKTAADLSVGMVQLAGDIASFRNVAGGAAAVSESLRAGLSGEAEPLRRFGIFLDEAKTKSKAMELGLADAHGELSDGAKIVSRYALIMEQSAKAHGDFARTSNSLANQQRIATANTENLKASLGALTAPTLAGATAGLNDVVGGLVNVAGSAESTGGAIASVAETMAKFALGPIGAVSDLADKVRALGGESDNTAASVEDRMASALAVYTKVSGDAKASTSSLAAAKRELRAAAAEMKAQQDGLNDTLKTEAERAKEVDEAYKAMRGSLLGHAEAKRSVESATRRLGDAEATLADKREALAELLRKPLVDERALAEARRQVETATRGVAAAEERAADARERLARARSYDPDDLAEASLSLREAELGVADSQDAVADAQKAVNDARQEGDPDALADAERRLTGAQLGLERALRTRRDAQQAVNDLNPNSEAGAQRIAEAEKDLAAAELGVSDAQRQHADAQAELAAVSAGDADRARDIAAAKRDLRDAEIGVADAQWGVVRSAFDLSEASRQQADAVHADADAVRRLREELYLLQAQHPLVASLLGQLGAVYQGSPTPAANRPGGAAHLGPRPYASGGWANPGQTMLVGEKGPELLRMGASGGMVYPNVGAAPTQINVYMPPGSDGDDVVAALRRYQQRNGSVPIRVSP